MKKLMPLVNILLATSGCQGMHQRLGMIEEKQKLSKLSLFKSFVNVVDDEKKRWSAIQEVLDKGWGQ